MCTFPTRVHVIPKSPRPFQGDFWQPGLSTRGACCHGASQPGSTYAVHAHTHRCHVTRHRCLHTHREFILTRPQAGGGHRTRKQPGGVGGCPGDLHVWGRPLGAGTASATTERGPCAWRGPSHPPQGRGPAGAEGDGSLLHAWQGSVCRPMDRLEGTKARGGAPAGIQMRGDSGRARDCGRARLGSGRCCPGPDNEGTRERRGHQRGTVGPGRQQALGLRCDGKEAAAHGDPKALNLHSEPQFPHRPSGGPGAGPGWAREALARPRALGQTPSFCARL